MFQRKCRLAVGLVGTLFSLLPACGNSGGGTGTSANSGGAAGLATGGASSQTESAGGIPTSGGDTGGGAGLATGGAAPVGGALGTGGFTSIAGTGGSIGTTGGATGAAGGPPLPPQLTWTPQGNATAIQGIWGSGPGDIYAVGMTGGLYHSVGDGTWQSQNPNTSAHLRGVWGTGADNIYVAARSNFILHSTGNGTWTHQAYTAGHVFYDVWGSGPNDIYAVYGGAIHSTGNGFWSLQPQSVTGGAPVFAIWGSSATDIYAATGDQDGHTIYHSAGDGQWRSQKSPAGVSAMQDIFGVDAQHIFAAGDMIVAYSSGDGNWTTQLTSTHGAIQALWAANTEAIYACDNSGYFYRSNGAGLWSDPQRIANSNVPSCFAIWGTSADNIYIGTSGTIYHGAP